MTVLVTGASGFVGAAIARCLLRHDLPVRVMLRETSPETNLRKLPVQRVYGDLLQPESLPQAVRGCRYLIHAAADYRLWQPEPAIAYRTNVDGTAALMHAALQAGVEKIVYTSSVATLAVHADRRPATEDDPVSLADMIGHYKRSKYLAEERVREMVEQHKLPAVIVNPSAPVGPGDVRPTPTGRTILDAARGKMPAYVDTGLNVVHVDDVADGHYLALQRGDIGQRYILGGENLSLAEILRMTAKAANRRPPRIKLPHWLLWPFAVTADALASVTKKPPRLSRDALRMARKHMFFSSRKATEQLGYRPRKAEAAIADAVEWFANHGYIP